MEANIIQILQEVNIAGKDSKVLKSIYKEKLNKYLEEGVEIDIFSR